MLLHVVSTYCQSGISTLVSESESTASGVSTDDKTAKPVTSLAGKNNALAHYEQSNSHVATIKYHIHYPIFMAFTGAAVISLMSYLYTGKLPGCFSYKWPGYEARYKGTTQDHCHPGQPYHAHNTLLVSQYGPR